MTSSLESVPGPTGVRFDEAMMWLSLSDDRVVGVPLAWYPRLFNATREQLEEVELSPSGMHWDEIGPPSSPPAEEKSILVLDPLSSRSRATSI